MLKERLTNVSIFVIQNFSTLESTRLKNCFIITILLANTVSEEIRTFEMKVSLKLAITPTKYNSREEFVEASVLVICRELMKCGSNRYVLKDCHLKDEHQRTCILVPSSDWRDFFNTSSHSQIKINSNSHTQEH